MEVLILTWIYTDSNGNVLVTNKNDMTGNTGWIQTGDMIPEPLIDSRGIPLYRFDGSEFSRRLQADVDNDAQIDIPTPLSMRVNQFADQLAMLQECIVDMSKLLSANLDPESTLYNILQKLKDTVSSK